MHFPAYGSGYDQAPIGGGGGGGGAGGAGGGALGSLARSASLSTARRKDPFSYPSDDVESGMAGGGDLSGPPYGRGASSGAPQPNMRPSGGGASQMPMPYINTSLRNSDNDIVMSPPGSSGNNSARYSHSQHASMPPPPIPRLQAATSPSASQQQPSNPYVPRDGPASDTWLHYRRSSARQSHSPQSGSVSPALVASPHSPPSMMQDTSSPHLLTPQGNLSNLPSSPRTGSRDLHHPPPATYRSHSQSFIMPSHSTTPSGGGRYSDNQSRSNSRDGPSSRQGFRPVRDFNDLKPHLNTHTQGRRADPDVPGAFLSVSLWHCSLSSLADSSQPLKCLTAALPQTYSLCNPAFKYESSDNPRRVLTKPSKPVYNDGADNEDWDYILYVNDVLGGEHGGDR